MRHIPETIAAALAQGAAKLCHAWIVTRRDGETLGFTDHDRPLTVMGTLCRPDSGFTRGAAQQGLGLDASDASVSGVIASQAITAADITAGLYDGARIDTYVVDWTDPSRTVPVDTGAFARLETRGQSFIAHVEGPMAQLDQVIGRRFSPLCDAVLGDARCGIMPAPGAVCDKRYRTCLETFDNALNFRGFPDLPGEDFLTVYPRPGDVLDGGSRRDGRR